MRATLAALGAALLLAGCATETPETAAPETVTVSETVTVTPAPATETVREIVTETVTIEVVPTEVEEGFSDLEQTMMLEAVWAGFDDELQEFFCSLWDISPENTVAMLREEWDAELLSSYSEEAMLGFYGDKCEDLTD